MEISNNTLKAIDYLHDANIESIQIKQLPFSEYLDDANYPKDHINIEIVLSLPVLENTEFSEKNLLCICTDVELFSIRKTNKWEWLIYEASIKKKMTWYEFRIDEYIFIKCKCMSYNLL